MKTDAHTVTLAKTSHSQNGSQTATFKTVLQVQYHKAYDKLKDGFSAETRSTLRS